jgi:hypothetical protein
MFLGTANMHYCEANAPCKQVASNLKFPNGLVRKDDMLYVPDSAAGTLSIYRILPSKDLEKVDEVKLGYGLDNASVDENGDIWVAAFPVTAAIFAAYDDPHGARTPTAVLRLRKTQGKYVVDKVIEDADGELLPAVTTVVHDAKTGRLFLSSKFNKSDTMSVTDENRCYFTVYRCLRAKGLSQLSTRFCFCATTHASLNEGHSIGLPYYIAYPGIP